MAAAKNQDGGANPSRDETLPQRTASNGKESAQDAEQDSDEDAEEEDEEPKLKYSRLTSNLGPVYRSGDSTSSFMVAGDKMIVGTHNGNIHILSIPSFQSLRTYNMRSSASVTAVSVSPFPPPLPTSQVLRGQTPANPPSTPQKPPSNAGASPAPRTPRQAPIPPIPSNQIYIASSSIDGNVCVSSLVDPKDVTLRNFARPVQAVALSPEYKSDRTYLSGGLAGDLILTTGGRQGHRENANTNSAAATAQGWLGAIGLSGNTGRDTVLHSGEGSISTIKWSLSGKFVVWANEHGIRIMRSNINLESADSESAWKRIGFIDKPNRRIWEEMSGVWKARADWVDDKNLESDDDPSLASNSTSQSLDKKDDSTLPHQRSDKHKSTKKRRIEKLVIGWGDAAWVVHVDPGGAGVGKYVGERSVGNADIVHFLRFEDCVVSGISLYTPSLLLILAYRTRDDDDNPITPTKDTPNRGIRRRHNGLSPELKLIDAATSDEVEVDALSVSRFETLSAADYHLSTLYVPHPKAVTPAQRNALEALGGGLWDAGASVGRIFSSGASIISATGSGDNTTAAPSAGSANAGSASTPAPGRRGPDPHPAATTAGLKIFIQSPYDCVLAVKRDLADHFDWELEHENYKDAWELIDDHPEIISTSFERPTDVSSPTSTPSQTKGSLADFFADESASQTTVSAKQAHNSAVEKEKRRIGDLWVQQLVNAQKWSEAGKVAGRVLGTSARWEHWIWQFAQANHFDEISPYIPTKQMHPPLPSLVYEVVLGHYIIHDRVRFKQLIDEWDPDLFDINSIVEAVKSKLSAGDVSEDTIEGGEPGRDWRILQDALAKLYLADGRQREALRCYIRLQNADAAMDLIRESHLLEAVRDDIPGFILLRVSKEQMESASIPELEEASSEAIHILVEEACRGIVPAAEVVEQLQDKGPSFQPFLYLYLRTLAKGEPSHRSHPTAKERVAAERLAEDGKVLAEDFADLIVELYAEYDRTQLMSYLRTSQSYNLDKAAHICQERDYIPELVHILSKTGQTKRALELIIEKLGDVSMAISFAKEQDDTDLWNDLLDYSMDKPRFIRGLLEEVGTAIDPIQLVRRIPEGLEIEGLREGIGRMVREYEIQYSISEGVARVLRGEVAQGMDMLRAGQKRGVKFEVIPCHDDDGAVEDMHPKDVVPQAVDPATIREEETSTMQVPGIMPDPNERHPPSGDAPPGHCTSCHLPFTLPTATEDASAVDDASDAVIPPSRDTLVGFACGHVFHLSCLLPKTSASASMAATLQARLAADAEAGQGYWGRSVGAKVAHAHVVKAAVGRGCVVCREREEAVREE